MNKLGLFFIISWLLIACTSEQEKLAKQIADNEQQLYADSLRQLDPMLVATQIDLYNKYAEKFSEDSLSPSYLFKGADLANGFGRGQEAVKMLETILVRYPGYNKSAAALFMQAFVYETSLHDNEKAIEKYKLFIAKYPDHTLAEAAQFSLLQLEQGLSPEDMVRMFEAKKDSLSNQNQ